jgi:hypothetical protein
LSRFSELGTNIVEIIQRLLESEELLKLLYYEDDDPLSKPDVPNPNSLLFNNIYPLSKIPEAEEKQKSIISIIFTDAKLSKNQKFKDYKIYFDIMVHVDLWRIKGSIRPYEIAQRIDDIFNELRGTELSTGKVNFCGFRSIRYNNVYHGFTLSYDVTNFN